MFYEIENGRDYKAKLQFIQQQNGEHEFLYDYGSSSEKPLGFITYSFRKNVSSRCIGVETNIELKNNSRTLFTVPALSLTAPMVESRYFQHLVSLSDSNCLDSDIRVNKMSYLVSEGFQPGHNYINEEQSSALRHIGDFFYQNRGRLNNLRINTKSEAVDPSQSVKASTTTTKNSKGISVEDEISMLIVNGNRLELPKAKLQHYPTIKTMLANAGGKYKKLGFEFSASTDVAALQEKLTQGNKVNIKQQFQFFETPEDESCELVKDADVQPGERWLEPSAGQAAVAKKLHAISNNGVLVELMDDNVEVLKDLGLGELHHSDFLACTVESLGGPFDKIVGNPPFSKNQDIKHFVHMVSMLKETGRVSCILSSHWEHASTKICKAFVQWLKDCGAKVIHIEAGAFKTSGTQIATKRVVLDKANVVCDFDTFLANFKDSEAA